MNSAELKPQAPASDEVVLRADHLCRDYTVRQGWFGGQTKVKALNGVSFELRRGRTLAVVGESGSGKSTLARLLTLIETPSAGQLTLAGTSLEGADNATLKRLRREVQMVFQNPYASLNPRKTVAQTLAEPLAINTRMSPAERARRIAETMRMVGLRPEHASRYPHMFSGGQRQRVAIARAMMLEPRIVVADEPVSALDVSIQAQILNLLMDLQERFGTSYVFITHNLALIERLADDIMVMYFGATVELGERRAVHERPRHPYTRALLSAAPVLHAGERRQRILLQGELPSPLAPPTGCAFHQRCPHAVERCRVETPLLRPFDGRLVACHRVEEIGEPHD